MIRLTVIEDKGRKHEGDGPPPDPAVLVSRIFSPQMIGIVEAYPTYDYSLPYAVMPSSIVRDLAGDAHFVTDDAEWIIEQVETLLGHPRTDAHSAMTLSLVPGDKVELVTGEVVTIASAPGFPGLAYEDGTGTMFVGGDRPFEVVKRKVNR